MTQIDYFEKRYNLTARLENAVECNCPLTARARCRDIARLQCEYDGSSITATTIELYAKYNLTSLKEPSLK